jgi:hypothetical protein
MTGSDWHCLGGRTVKRERVTKPIRPIDGISVRIWRRADRPGGPRRPRREMVSRGWYALNARKYKSPSEALRLGNPLEPDMRAHARMRTCMCARVCARTSSLASGAIMLDIHRPALFRYYPLDGASPKGFRAYEPAVQATPQRCYGESHRPQGRRGGGEEKSINYTVLYTASGQRLGSKEKTQLAGLGRAVQ